MSNMLLSLLLTLANSLHRRQRQAEACRTLVKLERAVRVELTITGFAVQCLWPLGDAREDLGHGWTRIHTNQKGSITESYFLTSFSRSYPPLSVLSVANTWSGRRDSNSRDEFGRLACFQLHHFRERISDFGLRISNLVW